MEEAKKPMGWKELYLKEDWWAIYLGLGIVITAVIFFYSGAPIFDTDNNLIGYHVPPFLKSLSVLPPDWTDYNVLIKHFSITFKWYVLQFISWLIIFSISTKILGFRQSEYIPSFIVLYLLSLVTFIIGSYTPLRNYGGFEAPLVALLLGLLISNIIRLPRWLSSGFRVEYYIKTGIVLLGATLPFTLIIWAGPIAFMQATFISVVTCLTIYFLAHKFFGLDKRFGAVLGVGAAICGVSAAIAVGGAVKARKEDISVTIALVTIWAIIMIFFIPYFSKLLDLPPAPVGAWIGSSEFADAAGLAAASAYDNMKGVQDVAVKSFTLMKVIGRDIWLGIWSFLFAVIACMKWEKEGCETRPRATEIWWRFPKFVLGFFIASVVITVITSGYSFRDFKVIQPELLKPIKNLRSWTFIFCFLSIGLTTRFRELASAGKKPFWAFTIGVVVNVVLGFVLSILVMDNFWIDKTAD